MLDKLGDRDGWRVADEQMDVIGRLGLVRFIFGAETDQFRPLGDTDSGHDGGEPVRPAWVD